MRASLIAASSAFALLVLSSVALAQPDVSCKKTETQAECFARLKCKPSEELEDCQKRLQKAGAAGQSTGDRQDSDNRGGDANNRGGDGNADDRGRDRDTDSGGRVERDNRGGDNRGGDDSGSYHRRRGHRNKTFGLGLELGEPDGLNGKYFLSDSGALDFGVGYIYDHYYYGDGFHLYADYLWHFSLASTPSFELPFYVGAGLRFWDFNYCYQGVCNYAGSAVGIRVPFGIAFDFNNAPVDIFLQLVPVLDFIGGDYYMRYGNREHFGIDGSVGVRFWFK